MRDVDQQREGPAGPHETDDQTSKGTRTSEWNSVSYNVEILGDRDKGPNQQRKR